MKNDIISANIEAYEKKYFEGYGTIYPEGHIIRFLKRFLEYEFKLQQKVLLDFGCGNGTHTKYFHSRGFNSFGFDSNKMSIESAKKRFPQIQENFKVHNAGNSILNLFPGIKFSVVIANQVLYYLDDETLNNRLSDIEKLLDKDGYVYFTMMGRQNHYYSISTPINKDNQNLRSVTFNHRLNETTIINFINDEDHLKSKFGMFEPVFTGFYDCTSKFGSHFHFQFIGKKK